MPRINLLRTYTHSGKDYGPGDVEIKEQNIHDDIRAKEDAYRQHLAAGGEPIAPITASLAGPVGGEAENVTALPRPHTPHPATAATANADADTAKHSVHAPTANPRTSVSAPKPEK